MRERNTDKVPEKWAIYARIPFDIVRGIDVIAKEWRKRKKTYANIVGGQNFCSQKNQFGFKRNKLTFIWFYPFQYFSLVPKIDFDFMFLKCYVTLNANQEITVFYVVNFMALFLLLEILSEKVRIYDLSGEIREE